LPSNEEFRVFLNDINVEEELFGKSKETRKRRDEYEKW
jgi:hypothetical protein